MSSDTTEILERALSLPDADRAALADSLLESLDSAVEEGVEEAWRCEIQRRASGIESGETATLSWDEARARLAAVARNE